MTVKTWTFLGVAAFIAMCGAGLTARNSGDGARAATPAGGSVRSCGGFVPQSGARAADQGMPVLQAYRYRMAGRVRPLLFWISRDEVGSGRIVWRGNGSGDVAYELLIGTDPALAPRAVNRWGYIVEDARQGATRVFGVISTDDEVTLGEVRPGQPTEPGRGRFKGIDARIAAGTSCSTTGTVETERNLTLHDVGAIVSEVRGKLLYVAPKDMTIAPDIRPGFLTAVAEAVDATIAARRAGPPALRRMEGHVIPYVYGPLIHDLWLTDIDMVPIAPGGDRAMQPVYAMFEIRTRNTGERYRFELQFPTDGALSGVPTVIKYQPRWWLQVELFLDTSTVERPAASRPF